MFNALFIDDEPLSHPHFKSVAAQDSRINLLQTFTSPFEILGYIKHHVDSKNPEPIDIIFTDIQMPHMSGIELAEQIQSMLPTVEIVFITAYDKYMLEAFQLYAAGYLLKPIAPDDIKKLLDKMEKRHLPLKKSDDKKSVKSDKLSISCLGSAQLPFKLPTEKAQELFFLYISRNGKPIKREKIYELLWPEFDVQKAYNNFYVTNTFLKRTIATQGFDSIIDRSDDYYSIPTSRIDCDYFEFMRLGDSTFRSDIKSLEAAVALYKGDFCSGKDWFFLDDVRLDCNKHYCALMYELATLYTESKKIDQAEKTLLQILDTDVFEEKAYNQLKKLYTQTNQLTKCKKLEKKYMAKIDSEY
jgi:two-component system LytT family response regulator